MRGYVIVCTALKRGEKVFLALEIGGSQCPTGRVFQYQVGYWKEYWVANRVWVR